MTDGNRDYTAGWRGYIGDAKPMVEINDDAPCYFEIDLGTMCELSAVNFVDDLQNTRRMFAAFVSADESAPIADWTRTAVLYGSAPVGQEGRTIRFEKPVVGRYVRLYSLCRNALPCSGSRLFDEPRVQHRFALVRLHERGMLLHAAS